jgi:hypothetical protein
MSQPQQPDPVKLIASLFSAEKECIDTVIGELNDHFGRSDWTSPALYFDRTRYYAREMGWPLHRRFISFTELVSPEQLVQIKLKTHEVERKRLRGQSRVINIDPGYLSAERLVLATGKNYVHRIYLSAGIYADLTLVYKKGSYTPLPWTYPDYADPIIIGWFNGVRKIYMNQLKEMRRID